MSKQEIAEVESLQQILANEGADISSDSKVYRENEVRFKEYDKMYDDIVNLNLDMLKEYGVINPEYYDTLKGRKGYAPFLRDIVDESTGWDGHK